MTREAALLTVALLAHQRSIHRKSDDSVENTEGFTIPYGDLSYRAGVPELKAHIGEFLREIAQWCDQNGWPPLNSLAVNAKTGKPGRGYNNAPGCSIEHWPEELAACARFDGYPQSI